MKGVVFIKIQNDLGSGIAAKAWDLALPIAQQLGLDLWDAVFEKEGAYWYLRILLEKSDGLSITDCEAFSLQFNKILDDLDFIQQSYIFEAGSPGIPKLLKRSHHFIQSIGSEITVLNIRPDQNGVRQFFGTLSAFDADSGSFTIHSSIDGSDTNITFDKKNVSKVFINDSSLDLFPES